MQAAAHNGKYDIVRQAGTDLVKIHHDLENEKPPRPIVQKPAPPLNYQPSPPTPLRHSHLAQKSVPPLNSQQLPPNPLSSPFYLAQKCAPTSPQVQNPALKCARPFLNGFKMRAACAPRCANFPKNPIFSPKTRKTAIFDNTPPPNTPTPRFRRPPAGRSVSLACRRCGRERRNVFYWIKTKMVSLCFIVCCMYSRQ